MTTTNKFTNLNIGWTIFFGSLILYLFFLGGGGQKTVCFNNCVLSTPSVQGWTQHTRLRSEIDVHLGKTLEGTVSGCSGRINGKWYIYLLIYHQKSNYECRCRCIPCMDPMGLFVFSCWHTLMCWGEMCWYAQVHQKQLMLMVPNSKSDWEC